MEVDVRISQLGAWLGGTVLDLATAGSPPVDASGVVLAATFAGISRSEDGGASWQSVAADLPDWFIQAVALAESPGGLVGLAASRMGWLYRSTDGGQTWERLDNGSDMIAGAALRVTALAVDEDNPQRVVAATAYGVGNRFVPGGIYESRDRGHTWAKVTEVEDVVTQLSVNQNAIYGATANGLARYKAPASEDPALVLPDLSLLANPSGAQVLILLLTAALAGLALIGRGEWVPGHRQAAT